MIRCSTCGEPPVRGEVAVNDAHQLRHGTRGEALTSTLPVGVSTWRAGPRLPPGSSPSPPTN